MDEGTLPRVLIIAEHASLKFGGEAALPLHFFRTLRKRGVEVWMIVHERTRDELTDAFPGEMDRITFIEDTVLHRFLWKCSKPLPSRLAFFTFGMMMRMLTQRSAKALAKKFIKAQNIDVVHQPIPVSPKEASMLHGLGVPVVIGPMNGGIDYPPAFRHMQSKMTNMTMGVGRSFANMMNRLMPGKRKAAALLVANPRTRHALPTGVRGEVIELVENGVDLSTWKAPGLTEREPEAGNKPTFAYMGRLVDWKAVDLLLEAFAKVVKQTPAHLLIMGDGPERRRLEADCDRLNLSREHDVTFAGWLKQEDAAKRLADADVLVLSSLMECGGAVVLEAMAMSKAVIATDWGGPADYLDDSCGILVKPDSRDTLIDSLAAAMVKLASSPQQREHMGEAGRAKIQEQYDWDVKAQRMIAIYRSVIDKTAKQKHDAFIG